MTWNSTKNSSFSRVSFAFDSSSQLELPQPHLMDQESPGIETRIFYNLRRKDTFLPGTSVPEECSTVGRTNIVYPQGEYRSNFHDGEVVVNCLTMFYRAPVRKLHQTWRHNNSGLFIGIMSNDSSQRQKIRKLFRDKLPATEHLFVVSGHDWDDIKDEYFRYNDMIWFDKPRDDNDIFDTSYKTLGFTLFMRQHAWKYQTLIATHESAFLHIPIDEVARLITEQDTSAKQLYGMSAMGDVRRAVSDTHMMDKDFVECATRLIPTPGYALMDTRMSIYKLIESCERSAR
jgi:hypothetical protein